MSWEVHITRKNHWAEEEGPIIAQDEWEALVDADPELEHVPDVLYGRTAFSPMPGIVWTGEGGGRRLPLALWWVDGEVRAKQPSRTAIAKMARLARTLGARLQGDDGEVYREDGSSFDPEVPAEAEGAPRGSASPALLWLRRLLGRR